MAYAVNAHVERLTRHLPFGPNAGDLYEERVDAGDGRPAIETRALSYVLGLLDDPRVSLIVLTGDAGHGKTHLTRRLVEQYGYNSTEALRQIQADTLGLAPIRALGTSQRRPLSVVRDLSEIEPAARGAERLAALLADNDGVAVVCANEGRLRDAVAHSGRPELQVILETLERSVSAGITSISPAIHVVNLNWQSVTAAGSSFVASLLRDWVEDRRRWATCRKCDAAAACPILANQASLGGADPRDAGAQQRRDGLEQMLRVIEQSGYVLTIRETLMLLAYLVTGLLDCRYVADEHARNGFRSAAEHRFLPVLFERKLSPSERSQLPVLERLRRLDPGQQSLPRVDDALLRILDGQDVADDLAQHGRFLAPPRTVRDARIFTERYRARVRRLRQEDYFDGQATESLRIGGDRVADRAQRLGLRHYGDFSAIVTAGADQARTTQVRDRILDGLHVLQGLRPKTKMHFFLADPAFARGESRAPIIARRFSRSQVKISSVEATWRDPQMTRAVDWTPRRLAVTFGNDAERLELDLLQFELVARAAGGVVARRFFGAESRRILARLGAIAAAGGADAQVIHVMDGPRLSQIDIDNGVFVVGEP